MGTEQCAVAFRSAVSLIFSSEHPSRDGARARACAQGVSMHVRQGGIGQGQEDGELSVHRITLFLVEHKQRWGFKNEQ